MRLIDPIRYVKLKASGRLPSPKGSALSIIKLLQQDNYKIDDLVRLVKSDPAIAGELLRFSNSASHGHRKPIISISDAITTLGARQVGLIVTAFSILSDHRHGTCPEFDYERFWSRALVSAISAQAFAGYSKYNEEECFTAGLLCNLGELALASIFPQRYGEIISITNYADQIRLGLEREAFGNDHRELNATLLLDWGLPLEMVTAIYFCEDPYEDFSQAGSRTHSLTLVLHLALAFADICVADDAKRKSMLPSLFDNAARLGINPREIYSIGELIISNWNDWGVQLKILTHKFDLALNSDPQ